MSMRRFLASICLTLAAWSVAPVFAADSTPNLADAVRKEGELFERYYKFVVFVDQGQPSRLVYQDLEKFEIHQQFLATLPEFRGLSRDQIDAASYRASADRRAYLGVLVIHSGDDGIFRSRFSLAMEEAPSVDVVAKISDLIRKSDDPHDQRLSGTLDLELLSHQEKGFSARGEELRSRGIGLFIGRAAPSSVSYTESWNVGTLEVVTGQQDLDAKFREGKVNGDTIILALEALREIPPVAGVISAVPLTPASHTVLLAQMYGIPVAYFDKAQAIFGAKVGHKLFLSARGGMRESFTRRTAEYFFDPSDEDLNRLAALRARNALVVPFKPEVTEIRAVEALTLADIGAYGGKASQFGALMRRLPENSASRARAIPVGISVEFLRTAKAGTGVTLAEFIKSALAGLSDADMRAPDRVEQVTKKIRDEIVGAKFPEAHLEKIKAMLQENFPGPDVKVRFRSSSNVEDGAEFNGAGLYDSAGVWLSGSRADNIEKKLKKVIASLYNARAYTARRKFGVDEARIGMGILVHPAFQDEVGNGVIRYFKAAGKNYFTYEIVTLKGEDEQVTHAESVTDAEIVAGSGDGDGIRERIDIVQPYRGYSRQRSLFPTQVYQQLGGQISKVAEEYAGRGAIEDVDIEAEFKLMPVNGRVVPHLKQVRRVPRANPHALQDGSKFVVLARSGMTFRRAIYNNTSAYADLWMPNRIDVDMDGFTEAMLRARRVPIHEVRLHFRGRTISIPHPQAVVESTDQGYSLVLTLPNDALPTLKLTISVELSNGKVHSLMGPQVYFLARVSEQDSQVLSQTDLDRDLTQAYEADVGNPSQEPSQKGRIVFEVSGSRPAVSVVGDDTRFFGDGDGRSVRIGAATVKGLGRRPLKIPADAIGYGANHHQGDESYIFDLYADPSLTADERRALSQSAGRYLLVYRNSSVEDDHKAIVIKMSGAVRKLGSSSVREERQAR